MSIGSFLQATNPALATELTKERLAMATRIAELETLELELDGANEELQARIAEMEEIARSLEGQQGDSDIVIDNLHTKLDRLQRGLDLLIPLQRHYAKLLNQWDGGKRIEFQSSDQWLDRLDTIEKEKRRPDA